MNIAAEMQHCMVTLDVQRAREIWAHLFPHLPPIKNDEEMLVTLHVARTQSDILNTNLRYYSHCWLIERGYPSTLPDHMRKPAERMYPRVKQSVGISVNASSDLFKPIIGHVRSAMSDAVEEIYADGREKDVSLIKQRMKEAKRDTVRRLLGVRNG